MFGADRYCAQRWGAVQIKGTSGARKSAHIRAGTAAQRHRPLAGRSERATVPMDGPEPASIPLRSEHAGMCGQLDLRPCFYSLASPRRAALASAPGAAQSRCRCGAPPRDTRPSVLQLARTHNARTHATTHTTACTLGVRITPTRPRKCNLPGLATSDQRSMHGTRARGIAALDAALRTSWSPPRLPSPSKSTGGATAARALRAFSEVVS